jgi:hypothetical protein
MTLTRVEPDPRRRAVLGLAPDPTCQRWQEVLKQNGFDVARRDVYPAVRTKEEFGRAIMLIWKWRVRGWWNYRAQLEALGVDSQEYDDALRQEIGR